ncbi:MAG: hypothetical protein JXP34_14480 [Planctomycetes bacterium]|nr:hypothetical protein [Planctomycetota bacterium]
MANSTPMPLPKDIVWRRLAFSPDMFDTEMDPQFELPRKWMTSLAAFYYLVPEAETKDLYPDSRLVYLRVTTSLTGVNLIGSSALLVRETFREDRERIESHLDAFQYSTLDLVIAGLRPYWPCCGAILQVAVYPHSSQAEGTTLWDFPYIQDFEPKKRELYEAVSRSGEVLSGSKSDLSLKKGLTTSDRLEESDILTGVSVKTGGWGFSAESSKTGKFGTERTSEKEQSELRSTDTSRERSETQSYTTTINQMYQPLLAYHLGTNRALWVISVRPHTVDSENVLIKVYPEGDRETPEGALIGRKLEGIQDMFLVVNVPKGNQGLCFQATLDAGYDLGGSWVNRVIVLRRNIQSCARFDGDGLKIDKSMPGYASDASVQPMVAYESDDIPADVRIRDEDLLDPDTKRRLVFRANRRSTAMIQRMLDGYTSGIERPKPFVETETFRSFLASSLRSSTFRLAGLVEGGMVTAEELAELRERRLETVGDLMRAEFDRERVVLRVRERAVDSAMAIAKRIGDYYRRRG